MSEKDNRIHVGDTVAVSFHNSKCTLSDNATVIHIPSATGDSWIFEDQDTGSIHYISEGCTVSKRPRTP